MSSWDLLGQTKAAFDTAMQLDQRMDTRSGSLLSVSGTVATLLFVFGSYLLSNIVPDYPLRNYMFYSLASGIIFALVSLVFSLLGGYGLTGRRVIFRFANPISADDLIELAKVGSSEDFADAEPEVKRKIENAFRDRLIEKYYQAIKVQGHLIRWKLAILQASQWSLVASILCILVLVAFLGIALSDSAINIRPLIGGNSSSV